MTSSILATALCAAVLLAALPEALGIMCYQCNSKVDSGCEQLPPLPANGTTAPPARYLVTCDNGPAGEPAFCRSSVITVLAANDGAGETRWVRSCGWVKYKNDCYKFDDDDHHEYVCQCFVDACNTAPASAPPALLLSLVALAALLHALLRR